MTREADAKAILASHRITLKRSKRPDGTIAETYRIQFTYPPGNKVGFSGETEEKVREKVYRYFNVSLMTFQELYEKWQKDPDLSESEKKKAEVGKKGFTFYIVHLGSKIAADVTPEDVIEAGKKHIASGCKSGTANTQIRSMRHMYNYGIKRGLVPSNPAAEVVRFRAQETRYERDYLTDRQICEYLEACKAYKEYMFAVFFICGIDMGRFVPLRWKDIDFERNRIDVNRRMKDRNCIDIVELERTEKVILEEPALAFEYLKLELKKQSEVLGIPQAVLKNTDRFIITHPRTEHNTSEKAFGLRLYDFLARKIKAQYKMGDIFFTSAVYAFKAECDMPSVASIIGYGKTIEMFRNPEKYDLFERKKSRSVNDYFDELYYGRKE